MKIIKANPESVFQINNDIEITILEVKKSGIKIGINAPRHILIFRNEVLKRLQNQGKNPFKELTTKGEPSCSFYPETRKNPF